MSRADQELEDSKAAAMAEAVMEVRKLVKTMKISNRNSRVMMVKTPACHRALDILSSTDRGLSRLLARLKDSDLSFGEGLGAAEAIDRLDAAIEQLAKETENICTLTNVSFRVPPGTKGKKGSCAEQEPSSATGRCDQDAALALVNNFFDNEEE